MLIKLPSDQIISRVITSEPRPQPQVIGAPPVSHTFTFTRLMDLNAAVSPQVLRVTPTANENSPNTGATHFTFSKLFQIISVSTVSSGDTRHLIRRSLDSEPRI